MFCLVTSIWAYQGISWCTKWAISDPSGDRIDALIDELRAADPEGANILAGLRDQCKTQALAAALDVARSRDGISGLRRMAREAKQGIPAMVRLAEIAADPVLCENEERRNSFLMSHGTSVELLSRNETADLLKNYLDRLQEKTKNRDDWKLVADDPVAMFLIDRFENNPRKCELLKFYGAEKEWLGEILAQAAMTPDLFRNEYSSREASSEPFIGVEGALEIAMAYHPLARDAVVKHDLGLQSILLLRRFGQLIQTAVTRYSLPLGETMEVVFSNQDIIAEKLITPENLLEIYNQKRSVWESARAQPFALRLNRDVPLYASSLLDKMGAQNVSALIYGWYKDEVVQTAAALDKYTGLAYHILYKYREIPKVRELLKKSDVGIRAIPFLAKFGDAGFAKLDENVKWLDKYFKPDGDPVSPNSWQAIPMVGGLVNVGENCTNGIPNEWGEIGWAAVDTLDIAFTALTLGAGKVIMSGGKTLAETAIYEGITEGSEEVGVLAGKKAIGQGLTRTGREFSEAGFEQAIEVSGREASFMQKMGDRALILSSNTGRSTVNFAVQVPQILRNAWKSVPPKLRFCTYAGISGTLLGVTVYYRTLPNLPVLFEMIGEAAGTIARNATTSLAALTAAALTKALSTQPEFSVIPAPMMYMILLFLFGSCAWFLNPWRKRIVRAV
ncbi:MAG: hypothetical protein HQM09_02140 [Candidatus Riflebacteria bacterium]|nr:hypothetical protein [Candidatus Riflebacteria bacterium]